MHIVLCNLFGINFCSHFCYLQVIQEVFYNILSFYQFSVSIHLRLNTNWLLLLGFTKVEAEYTWPFSTKCCIKTCCSLSLMCLYCYSHFRYHIFMCCTVSFIYLFLKFLCHLCMLILIILRSSEIIWLTQLINHRLFSEQFLYKTVW